MKLSPTGLSPEVKTILASLPVTLCDDGAALDAVQDTSLSGFSIEKTADRLSIRYEKPVYLFRALGLAAEQSADTFSLSQSPSFVHNGAMIDCSRNAVPTLESIKAYIRSIALMGHDTLMLYTEDTYEVAGHPYFGYMRGRYSAEELREADAYAAAFGVEIVPCIQTLAHLASALRWDHAYGAAHDIDDILLVDAPETYDLIDAMIRACRSCFRSRRIHIGMDEAENLGRGKFRDRFGVQDTADIMCRHLSRVMEICGKYDFHPMIWSDMFFKMVPYEGGSYYRGELPASLLEKVPAGVDLVYWDYYSLDQSDYENSLRSHALFKNNHIVFAGGAWRWTGFAPRTRFSLDASRKAIAACRLTGVGDVFTTLWGDNGGEASLFAPHPVVQLFAELSFNPTISDDELRRRFATCTGGNWDDFLIMDEPDSPIDEDPCRLTTPARYLLYQDPMLGLFDAHVQRGFGAYYEKVAAHLHAAEEKGGAYAYLFTTLSRMCDLLALKAEVGLDLVDAYKAGDKAALRRLATETLPEIAVRADAFRDAVEAQWMRENKPFGFEVMDIRLAGIGARARSAARRVLDFVDGRVGALPELTEPRLTWNGRSPGNTYFNRWAPNISACPV